jgi:hypothetical protein
MLAQKKGKHVRLYVLEDDEAGLEKLASNVGITQTTALTLIVSAGLKACGQADYRLPLPLKFQIVESKSKK